MTSKGQITVPVAIRRKLGLKQGQQFNIKRKGNTVVVQVYDWRTGLAEMQERMAAHLKAHNIKPLSDEELDAEINRSAQAAAIERYDKSQRS